MTNDEQIKLLTEAPEGSDGRLMVYAEAERRS